MFSFKDFLESAQLCFDQVTLFTEFDPVFLGIVCIFECHIGFWLRI